MRSRALPWIWSLAPVACALALGSAAGPGPMPRGDATEPAQPSRAGPSLLVPVMPDSAPSESPPAPLLVPGRPAQPDSTVLSPAQRAQQAYELGLRLEAQGMPGVAIVSYRNALRFDPTLPDANLRMAKLFLTRDEVREATKCLLMELTHHPENVEANRLLGLCLVRLGDSERAIAQLERMTRQHPKDGSLWHALGSVYLAAGRPRDAERALRRAVRLEPTTAEELRDLGAALAEQGRTREARTQYRRALALSPGDAASWLNLGNIERRAGHPDSALALYRRAEAADSTFAPGLEAQIQVLKGLGRTGETPDVYRRWLHHHPDEHATRLEAIGVLEDLGRGDEALEVARQGVKSSRTGTQAHVILAMMLQGRGELREALAVLRDAERLARNEPPERERITRTIAAMRASAPDSLREFFVADSVAAARRPGG